MDWQSRLISVYVKISSLWEQGISSHAERMSNHTEYALTDPEVITIFLNGIMMGRTQLKQIHTFTASHLHSWFPQLASYEAFVRRLNEISGVFALIVEMLSDEDFPGNVDVRRKIVDSMPIVLAKSKRSNRAKVSPENADKGYCGSKDTYYYGVKLHIIGCPRNGTIPVPEYVGLTPASCHDLTAFRQVSPYLFDCDIFADKAYIDSLNNQQYQLLQSIQIATPVKLKKGQDRLDSADRMYSTAVSSLRQPIESLFNWLQEKTGIQIASKVRSTKGLMVHIFGRLAAGILLMLNF